MIDSTNRPPSCDLLKPKLKKCPACAGNNVEIPRGVTWVICRDSDCNLEGPIDDPLGHKWNSIPRRSEVAELLWRIQNVLDNPELNELEHMGEYADKLRNEWKL